MFYPVFQRPENFTGILVRTDGDPAGLTASVRAVLRDVDPGIPLVAPDTLGHLVDQSMADRDLTMMLLIVFASLALLLASLGVYSVMAYSVAQRNPEIGVRMALGASTRAVARLVLFESARPVIVGAGGGMLLAAGAAGALMATPAAGAVREMVQVLDPVAYISPLLVIIAACSIAASAPALRAARVDPMTVLRKE